MAECRICMCLYDERQRRPKVLPCGHSVCLNCLQLLEKKQCPDCRRGFSKQAGSLPDNYEILKIIREEPSSERRSTTVCRFWCMSCSRAAARNCEEEHPVLGLRAALRAQLQLLLDQAPRVAQDFKAVLQDLQEGGDEKRVLGALQLLAGPAVSCQVAVRQEAGPASTISLQLKGQGAACQPLDYRQDTALRALLCVLATTSEARKFKAEKPPVKEPPVEEIEVDKLSTLRSNEGVEEKTALLERVRQRGVRKLDIGRCDCDPYWVVQLLQAAAPQLERLLVGHYQEVHLSAIQALPRLTCLILSPKLDFNALDSLLSEPPVLPPLPHQGGLKTLKVIHKLPRKTLLSLMRAHGRSLEKAEVVVDSEGDSWWPFAQDNLHSELAQCGLQRLRRLVLLRGPCRSTKEQCISQKRAVRQVLPNCQVLCRSCDKVMPENYWDDG